MTTLRSSIHKDLMRFTVWRSTIFGVAGAALLFWGGTFLKTSDLNRWGFPLFLVSMGFITAGMLPYRRLKQLEMNPYSLTTEGEWLHLSKKGVPLLSLKWADVQEIKWIEQGRKYGIGFILKQQANVVTYNHYAIQKLKGCDIFLPYFSERSYQILKDQMD